MKNTKHLYDEYYFKTYGGRGYRQAVMYVKLRPVLAAIKEIAHSYSDHRRPVRILDVGCAKGYLVKMMKDHGFEAYGVDISEYALKHSPIGVKENLFLINVERERLPFRNHFFDIVISIGTFEHLHLNKMPFILSEIQRVLGKNSLLIISVPYFYNKAERKKIGHVSVLPNYLWIKLVERHHLRYESNLSKKSNNRICEEMARLYVAFPKETRIMKYLNVPNKRIKLLIFYLILKLKRRIYPSAFIAVFMNKLKFVQDCAVIGDVTSTFQRSHPPTCVMIC